MLNPELIKGPWRSHEDEQLMELVAKHGTKKWSFVATHIRGRNGKQCRERWTNHLNPGIKKNDWAHEEEVILATHHGRIGNRWAELATLSAKVGVPLPPPLS